MRRTAFRAGLALAVALALTAAGAQSLAAQADSLGRRDTTAAPAAPAPPAARDTAPAVRADTARRMTPGNAFWRSLVLPGWGQAATGRHFTGALFVAWEGTTMMMTLKAESEVRYFERSGSPNVRAKRQEVQDWLVLWIFNHLFSGAEAYVAAHLQNFPTELKVEVAPHAVGVSLPLPRP